MSHVRVSQSLNLRFGVFTVLLFHTVLLALIHACRGQHRVISPPQPIVALVGEDIILPSSLDPPVNAFGMTVEWTRPDLDPRFVLKWRHGVELENKKHPSYVGRASVFTEELKHGNVSLKLSEVKISDGGTYRCFIPDFNIDSTVQLVVGAASSPVFQMTRNSSAVVLQCEFKGWYPEPEVLLLDNEGNVLSAGPTETVRGPDGLYTVSSRVTVEKRHSNTFTCRVQQKNINQTRETQSHDSDDFFEVQSSSAPVISTLAVLLAFCIMIIFAVFFFVCKWRRKIIKITRSDEEAEEDRDRALLRTDETVEMKDLDKGEKQKKRNLIFNMSSWNLYKWFKDEHQRREKAEREVKRLTEEKQSVENKCQQLQTDLENKTKESLIMKLTEEKQRRENEWQWLQMELETTRTEVDKLTAEVKKLTEEKLKSENERQKLQKELDTTRTEFKNTNEAINTQWKQSNDELKETRLQLKRKGEENNQLRRELKDQKQKKEKAEKDLKDLMIKHKSFVILFI